MNRKILEREELFRRADEARAQGRAIVFTNGCFDILHAGHARYLALAAGQGDLLMVAVNSDKSVKSIKGSLRPIIPQAERAELVAALACVSFVTIFDEDDPGALIRRILPDVLVKGSDWDEDKIVGAAEVKAAGGRVFRAPLSEGLSTSAIIARIRGLKE
jgi:rfaE bifunctional protein nucleotidyltransferase chain/domain